MKTLDRYILREFAKLLVTSMCAFVALFILVELFENVDDFMSHSVPVPAIIEYFLYRVPFVVSEVSPVAVLVSVLLGLGNLSRHGEISAMKAGGARLMRVFAPLFFAGALVSVGIFLVNEFVTPETVRRTNAFKREWLGQFQGSVLSREGLWVKTNSGIFSIRQMDLRKKELYGVTYYGMERPFEVRSRVSSRLVRWDKGRWVAPEAVVWGFGNGANGEANMKEERDLVIEGLGTPDELIRVEDAQKDLSFQELNSYVQGLEADGYDASRYLVDLYSKITFPAVNFIMVLVGIPFALKTARHGGMAAGIGISIIIAFSYWIIFAVARSLGQSAALPPLIAAVFPDVLFLAIGALLLGYVRE